MTAVFGREVTPTTVGTVALAAMLTAIGARSEEMEPVLGRLRSQVIPVGDVTATRAQAEAALEQHRAETGAAVPDDVRFLSGHVPLGVPNVAVFDTLNIRQESTDTPLLWCSACDRAVCDVEHGDDFEVLVRVALLHLSTAEHQEAIA